MNAVSSSSTLHLRGIAFPWSGFAGGLAWLLHAALLAAVLAALWQLQRALGLERWLHSPWLVVNRFWLPLVALLAYGLIVLGVGLWHSLGHVTRPQVAADLDATWTEAQQFLERTCFNARQLPLYLILGSLTPGLKAWLDAIGASTLLVRSATPLHVYANADAIFVVCDTASQLGTNAPEPSAETLERLRHVCRLLDRHRLPQRLLQGVVVAAPFQVLQSDMALQQTIDQCRHDVATVRQATGLDCPLYLVLTGEPAGSASGATAEVSLPGWFQRFTLSADALPQESMASIGRGLDHLFARKLPQLARAGMQLDVSPAGAAILTDILLTNIGHYVLLTSASAWRPRLHRLLTLGTCVDADEPALVAGCYYLPSNSADAPVHRALWSDMQSYRDAVTWTPETLADTRREERYTQNGYGLVLAGWVGALLVAGWYFVIRA